MTTYVYYIAYAHGNGFRFGFGAIELSRSHAINSFHDIVAIQEKIIEKDASIENPLVINFQLLRVEE